MSGNPKPAITLVRQQVFDALRSLQTEGGSDNFVIFNIDESKNYYVQFTGENGGTELYGECVGNAFLKEPFQIDPEQLTGRGWDLLDVGNHACEWIVSSDGERAFVADAIVEAMVEVYGYTGSPELQVELNLE